MPMLTLRGIPRGPVFNGPGARGFFGEVHRPLLPLWQRTGLNWEGYGGCGFAAKTTPLLPRLGNMPMKEDGITPKEILPRCIIIKFLSGHVLNAVSLTSPGAEALLKTGLWQKREDPFFLSFMAVENTKGERLEELKEFCILLLAHLDNFKAPVALQINFGCPNTDLNLTELSEEVEEALEVASCLGVPLVPNFNPLVPLEVLKRASLHPSCDAFWIANTIPWGTEGIDWKGIFGTEVSPLQARGFPQAGGLSGPACRRMVAEKVVQACEVVGDVPIVAGNGIQSVEDVLLYRRCGAVAVALGIAAMVRHWRMPRIIQAANLYDSLRGDSRE